MDLMGSSIVSAFLTHSFFFCSFEFCGNSLTFGVCLMWPSHKLQFFVVLFFALASDYHNMFSSTATLVLSLSNHDLLWSDCLFLGTRKAQGDKQQSHQTSLKLLRNRVQWSRMWLVFKTLTGKCVKKREKKDLLITRAVIQSWKLSAKSWTWPPVNSKPCLY